MIKTTRNGKAIELHCETCDQPFAEILPDRFLIYSHHYGKQHTAAYGADEMNRVAQVVESGTFLKLECSCGLFPCAIVQLGRLVIKSRHKVHGWQTHTNALMPEDVREICSCIGQSGVIIPGELSPPSLTEDRPAN